MNKQVDLVRAFLNSCIVTFSYTILVLFFCSIGGYAFSVYDFPGKKVLFTILLGTMMIPATAGMIPWFIMMSRLGWVNDFKALIIRDVQMHSVFSGCASIARTIFRRL